MRTHAPITGTAQICGLRRPSGRGEPSPDASMMISSREVGHSEVGELGLVVRARAGAPVRNGSTSPLVKGVLMPYTIYQASVPIFAQMLNNMLGWLDKAEALSRSARCLRRR